MALTRWYVATKSALLHPLKILVERLHAHIVRCDAVKPLVGMLDGPDSDEVVDTLSWLAENGMLCLELTHNCLYQISEDARTQIVQLNAIPTLVKLLESPQCNSVANILDLIQCGGLSPVAAYDHTHIL